MKSIIALFLTAISALADIVIYADSHSEIGGNFSDVLSVPRFDGSFGTLTHVSAVLLCVTDYNMIGHHGPITTQEDIDLYCGEFFIGSGTGNVSISNHNREGEFFVGQTIDDNTSEPLLIEEFIGFGDVQFTVKDTLFKLGTSVTPPSWDNAVSQITLTVTYTYTP